MNVSSLKNDQGYTLLEMLIVLFFCDVFNCDCHEVLIETSRNKRT